MWTSVGAGARDHKARRTKTASTMKDIIVILIFCWFSIPARAAIFHIDPANGSMQNDGSAAAPWSTLAEVLDADLIETRSYDPLPYQAGVSVLVPKNVGAPVHAGDTLLLYDGLHGECFYRGAYNTEPITIMAAEGAVPILRQFHLQAGAKWRLVGLHVSAEPYGVYDGDHRVFFESHGWHGPVREVEVRDCVVYSATDITGWTDQDWLARHSDGIHISGDQALVVNNTVTNVHFGIIAAGDSIQAIGNSVVNFSADGMRPLGSDILFEGNTIKNCYDVDENHDDGIQSFTTLGFPFHRVVLRGNTIIGYEDPDQPYRAALQGIGCFDGPFIDWVVENNVVVVDHWHGISLYGAQDCVFRNNTVIDPTPDVAPGPAWIMVNDIDGFASSGCVVANNLANTFSLEGTDVYVNNIALSDEALYAQYFVDAPGHDLHLLATSPAVDGADDLYAPPTDIEGNARPVGAHSDVGAYEYLGPLHIDAESGVGAGIYPVPTRERLFFRIGDAGRTALVEVVDQHGCIVLRERHLLSEGLDVRGLMPGIYTVRFGNVTVRFVKE